MNDEKDRNPQVDKGQSGPYRVRIPRFITDEDVGLGDVIQRVTHAVGIEPCGGCQRRATMFNRWVAFSSRRPR